MCFCCKDLTSNDNRLVPYYHCSVTLLCFTQVIHEFIIVKMGWTWGSEAGPQLITLKARDSVENGGDGVEAVAVPNESAHLWKIKHEGCKKVSYIDFCLTVACNTLGFLRLRLHGYDFAPYS